MEKNVVLTHVLSSLGSCHKTEAAQCGRVNKLDSNLRSIPFIAHFLYSQPKFGHRYHRLKKKTCAKRFPFPSSIIKSECFREPFSPLHSALINHDNFVFIAFRFSTWNPLESCIFARTWKTTPGKTVKHSNCVDAVMPNQY